MVKPKKEVKPFEEGGNEGAKGHEAQRRRNWDLLPEGEGDGAEGGGGKAQIETEEEPKDTDGAETEDGDPEGGGRPKMEEK